jgi:hypothetical protein
LFESLNQLFTSITFRRGFLWSIESGALEFRDRASALTADLAPAFELTLHEADEDDLDGTDRGRGRCASGSARTRTCSTGATNDRAAPLMAIAGPKFRGLYLLELGIRSHNDSYPVPPAPGAAIRFE